MSTGFIFPAFISEYLGSEPEILSAFSNDFKQFLNEASSYLKIDLKSFTVNDHAFIDSELKAQYISYIFGCSVVNILENGKIQPDLISGYSMGLYACLYCGHSITFTQGLDLIGKAYDLIKENTTHLDTGMGSIVGLSKEDISELLKDNSNGVEIVTTNGEHSFLLSGLKPAILKVLEAAKNEGALNTSLLNIRSPYHIHFLDGAAQKFDDYISDKIQIKDSSFKIVSALDQRVFNSSTDIHAELVNNLNSKIDWLKTMEKMIGLNIDQFIECGAGNSLFRIGKFIKGDFKIYTMNKLDKILDPAKS